MASIRRLSSNGLMTGRDGKDVSLRFFRRVRRATGVHALFYCLGEGAKNVLTSTNVTDEERKKHQEVLGKFDGFFKVR